MALLLQEAAVNWAEEAAAGAGSAALLCRAWTSESRSVWAQCALGRGLGRGLGRALGTGPQR